MKLKAYLRKCDFVKKNKKKQLFSNFYLHGTTLALKGEKASYL